MIELDGIEYTVQTPTENAYDMIAYINNYCATNNIKNSKGEVIYIEANPTNPLYIMLFGLCYLVSILQKLIYSAGTALSVSSSSDRQLLNIARIANVKRREATYTTIMCTVYAEDDGACIITNDLTVSYNAGGTQLSFSPTFELTIPAGGAGNIILIADTLGAYSISANEISGFDTPVANLRRISSRASTPGQDQETIASLRQRLQNRIINSTQIDRCMDDIVSLPGVALCNIFYNYSSYSPETVGDILVQPREALLIVQGYNENIARTFYNHLICTTTPSGGANDPVITQAYTTLAGQNLSVNIHQPVQEELWVRVYVNDDLTSSQQQTLRDAVLSLGANLVIGQDLSAFDITKAVSEALPTVDVEEADLGKADETGMIVYTYKAIPEKNGLLTINSERILIQEV